MFRHSLIAFFYTDPGSGALILQLLIASFFGGLFYIRSFVRKLKAIISGGKSGEQHDQQAGGDQAVPTTPGQNEIR